MAPIRRFDHVGITVADLDTVTDFFVGLGLEVEGRTFVEGEFLDTVCGIPDSRTEVVMLTPGRRHPAWSWRASSGPSTTRDRRTRWPTSWACATSASRSTISRPSSTGWRRTATVWWAASASTRTSWRMAYVARTGGHRRGLGGAHRLRDEILQVDAQRPTGRTEEEAVARTRRHRARWSGVRERAWCLWPDPHPCRGCGRSVDARRRRSAGGSGCRDTKR